MKKLVPIVAFVLMVSMLASPVNAKKADLAGVWYKFSPDLLEKEINDYLSAASIGDIGGEIIGCIAPHAGIRFSGPIAAYTYKALAYQKPTKIIVVGFSHKLHIPDCVAVFSEEDFETPLGNVSVDANISKKFIEYNPKFREFPKAFVSENSIELQLPFIARVFKGAEVVLLAMCDQDKNLSQFLSDALYNVLKNEKDFVIIASSDMCHYLPYFEAEKTDKDTIEIIKKFDPEAFYSSSLKTKHKLMCGYGAVYSVMRASRLLGANKSIILKYANSGDFEPATKNRVVGYVSALFVKKGEQTETASSELLEKDERGNKDMLNESQRKELLKIARDTIKLYLETGQRFVPQTRDEELKQSMGAFVTLHKNGRLRGCIGRIIAAGPIDLTVRDMAIASATEDSRFSPVGLDELKDIDIEISVLSAMKKITDHEQIVMGKHGVMVEKGFRSGIYLPQVADETGWTRDEFMNNLCVNKAGISANAWKNGSCNISVFTAEVFGEKEK